MPKSLYTQSGKYRVMSGKKDFGKLGKIFHASWHGLKKFLKNLKYKFDANFKDTLTVLLARKIFLKFLPISYIGIHDEYLAQKLSIRFFDDMFEIDSSNNLITGETDYTFGIIVGRWEYGKFYLENPYFDFYDFERNTLIGKKLYNAFPKIFQKII